MWNVVSGVLALIGGLLLLSSALLSERDRRRKTNTVSRLFAPAFSLCGVGFVVEGVVTLAGGDSSSWLSLIATLFIVVGGVGAFTVAMVSRRRQSSQ